MHGDGEGKIKEIVWKDWREGHEENEEQVYYYDQRGEGKEDRVVAICVCGC